MPGGYIGISPGGRPINTLPLSSSHDSNWVARAGGLPPYIRGVARGIAKGGKVTSRDIKIAIGRMKVWAAGGGNVSAAVRIAAQKALAQWYALRAKAHALSVTDIIDIELAKLTKSARDALPASAFVFPSKRAYPIHDLAHARNALSRSAGKPEAAVVRAAVYRRYPALRKRQAA